MFTPTRLALATVLSLAFTPLAAQDFDESYAAYQAGDYATALQGLKPLAEQGSAGAQTILGVMYNQGQGVPLDDIEAGRWFLFRIELAGEMTPADISKAQEMARECMASDYQNCGE